MMPVPATDSLAPRRFAGQRPPATPQGDGGMVANGLPAQAAQKPRFQTARPPAPQASAQPAPAPQSFAQMQTAGVARPTPSMVAPSAPTMQMAPGTQPEASNPIPQQTPGTQTTPYHPATTGTTTTTPGTTGATGTTPATAAPYAGPLDSQLQTAISSQLSQPSRYNTPELLQERDALTQGLNQQFAGQQKHLDEEMARRGIGTSSIAAGYNGDLKGQQANAMSSMNASLLKDSAANHAADMNAATSAGQNYANMGLQNNQFQQSLAQALSLGQMGDKTANRGIDAQSALANNDLMLRVLAALGLPAGSAGAGGGTGTVPAGSPTGPTGNPSGGNPSGGSTGTGPSGTGGTDGGSSGNGAGGDGFGSPLTNRSPLLGMPSPNTAARDPMLGRVMPGQQVFGSGEMTPQQQAQEIYNASLLDPSGDPMGTMHKYYGQNNGDSMQRPGGAVTPGPVYGAPRAGTWEAGQYAQDLKNGMGATNPLLDPRYAGSVQRLR